MDCIFCKIVEKEIPAHKIWEDEHHIAFLDIKPIQPGHTLVITKKHEPYVFNLEPNEAATLMKASQTVAKKLEAALEPKRIGLQIQGFDVDHTHVHLIPINNPGDMNSNNAKETPSEELTKIKDKIRQS